MTVDNQTSDDLFDRDTFESDFAELIDHASEAGVDIVGGYEIRTPQPERADYAVEITKLVPAESPDLDSEAPSKD